MFESLNDSMSTWSVWARIQRKQFKWLTIPADAVAAAATFAEFPAAGTTAASLSTFPSCPPAARLLPVQCIALLTPVPGPISACSLTIASSSWTRACFSECCGPTVLHTPEAACFVWCTKQSSTSWPTPQMKYQVALTGKDCKTGWYLELVWTQEYEQYMQHHLIMLQHMHLCRVQVTVICKIVISLHLHTSKQ